MTSQLTNDGESSPLSEEKRLEDVVEKRLEDVVEYSNLVPGKLPDYDCPKCRNKGVVACLRNAPIQEIVWEKCDCVKKRRYFRDIRESGLSEMLTRYTLEAWQCREPWQRNLLEMVKRYAEAPEGWFCLSGTPGTGKTHLCTALCGLLMEKGLEMRYMLWRDVSTKAKAVVNDAEAYQAIVEPLKRVRVLYIDDLFKTGKAVNRASGQREPMSPTSGDINLAFEILNARYTDSRLLTIISTELPLGEFCMIDEALGSRIVERTRGRYQDLSAPNERRNWRLKHD